MIRRLLALANDGGAASLAVGLSVVAFSIGIAWGVAELAKGLAR